MCQLAITEIEETDVTSDMVMTSLSHVHNQRIGFGFDVNTSDNLEIIHQLREQYLETKGFDSLDIDTVLPTGNLIKVSVFVPFLFILFT